MTDSYRTLADPCGPYELKEKASRFIAHAAPAATIADAERFVALLRKRFHDAAHIGWACRFGDGVESSFRYSDDGEPSGSAGVPIYQELVRLELFNVVCAVVRYFGGVKLGTGGLARAFGAAARGALDTASLRTVLVTVPLTFRSPFELVGTVMHLAGQFPGTTIVSQEYDAEGVCIEIAVPRSMAERFGAAVIEKSSGRIRMGSGNLCD
ncbi:MAG TPA: YigZ family protein [bacterium]|nr:YigZ family protein [bacterium]